MIRGIRLVSVERGFDPRDFVLQCFGGAGPVHAVKLAQELSIPKILVPYGPGVTCALGLLMADFRHDYSHTFLRQVASLKPEKLSLAFEELEAKALGQMLKDGVPEGDVRYSRSLDMRYNGQGYELEIHSPRKKYTRKDLDTLCAEFTRVHVEQYGYGMPQDTVEAVSLRLTVMGVLPKPNIARESHSETDPAPAFKGCRKAYFGGQWESVPTYERTRLHCGNRIEGPTIIEQLDSTTVVCSGYRARVDEYRNLLITQTRNDASPREAQGWDAVEEAQFSSL